MILMQPLEKRKEILRKLKNNNKSNERFHEKNSEKVYKINFNSEVFKNLTFIEEVNNDKQ